MSSKSFMRRQALSLEPALSSRPNADEDADADDADSEDGVSVSPPEGSQQRQLQAEANGKRKRAPARSRSRSRDEEDPRAGPPSPLQMKGTCRAFWGQWYRTVHFHQQDVCAVWDATRGFMEPAGKGSSMLTFLTPSTP